MTERGIKPKRLDRQTEDETPPTPAAEQNCSDRSYEYCELGGKLQPCSFRRRRCVRCVNVLRPTSEQPTKVQVALPKHAPSRYRLLIGGSRVFLHLPRGSTNLGDVLTRNNLAELFARHTGHRPVPTAFDHSSGRHVSLVASLIVSSGMMAPRGARQAVIPPTSAWAS
jgi:hypothetical protein